MTNRLRWGLLAAGSIAGKLASAIERSQSSEVVAVGSRSQDAAEQFGDRYGIRSRYGSYEELLADEDVEIVYISTPHPMHAEWAIRAADAGKHILCEKPLTINHQQAVAVIDAARRNDVFLMEAFAYRTHPHTRRLVELVSSGAIGRLCAIQVSFGFDEDLSTVPRLTDHSLGGGGILDIGCYCTSMSRLLAGAAVEAPFASPLTVKGSGYLDPTDRVDHYAAGTLEFPDGVIAQIACSIRLVQENVVRVYGRDGQIVVPRPLWLPPYPEEPGELSLHLHHRGEPEPTEIVVEADAGLFTLQVENVAEFIDARQSPAMSWEDTLDNMKTLDRWRKSFGFTYDFEEPATAGDDGG